MDATYDYQVWNQPVVGYSYSYFNPATHVPARSMTEAAVSRADFHKDKFAEYRSNDTETIVGIAMEVSYTVETAPTHNPTDGPHRDRVTRVKYLYDLELDFAGKIIGGEWYQNAHPDFLWTPGKEDRALPPWEARSPLTGTWQSNQPIPDQWQQVASITSEYSKAPLAVIVEQLIAFSNS